MTNVERTNDEGNPKNEARMEEWPIHPATRVFGLWASSFLRHLLILRLIMSGSAKSRECDSSYQQGLESIGAGGD
jgi:hypothetical protein